VESKLTQYARGLLAFTAACLPLYVVRWQYGPVPTTLLENLIIATVALYVVGRWREGRLRLNRTPLDIPILLLLVSGAISVVVARDHRAALGLYKAFFIEPVAIFYVASDLLRKADDYRHLLLGFAIGSSAFALLNIANFIVAFAGNKVALGSPPVALYGSANEVAMYLEPPLAFAAALVLFSERRLDRALGLLWGLLLGSALILTLSRGAFLACAVFAIFVVVSLNPVLRKPLFAGLAVLAAVVIAAVALGSHTPLVIHRLSLKALEYTSVTRFEIYWDTLRMLLPHFVFGLGLGGYLLVYHNFPEIYPHDIWLSFWAELGLLGLIAFAIIFIRLLRSGWRALPFATGFDRVVLWGAVGALVLWGVHGIFDSPYWKNDMSVEFWLVAAMLMLLSRSTTQRGAGSEAGNIPAEQPGPA
jgi:O-antigen ligase